MTETSRRQGRPGVSRASGAGFPNRKSAPGSPSPYRRAIPGFVALAVVAIAGLGFRLGRGWSPARSEPALSATTVVQQVRDAAKLVSTEVIAAVVAKQEDLKWYGNRILLVVVPGRALVGVEPAARR